MEGAEVKTNYDEEKEKWKRPPSSYGSMKSESEESEGPETDENGAGHEGAVLPERPAPVVIGSQNYLSPETLYTMNTEQTKPPGALVIETGSGDLDRAVDDYEEDEDEEDEDMYITNSPEPPEPVEFEGLMQTDEDEQPGRFPPEQDMPFVFTNILKTLTPLKFEEMYKFRSWLKLMARELKDSNFMEGDLLDFVDKMIEVFGHSKTLYITISCLDSSGLKAQAEELQKVCMKALIRYRLTEEINRKKKFVFEGLVESRVQNKLNQIFVEPKISKRICGAIDPSHEFRSKPITPLQVPDPDSFTSLKNLFRLTKDDGSRVRTVATTALPGSGMTLHTSKFCLDWAENTANRDLECVVRLPFHRFWSLKRSESENVSLLEMIHICTSAFKGLDSYLEEADHSKRLIIMDCLDSFQDSVDWLNTPLLTDIRTPASPEVLMVNIVRGNLLPGARVWVLGRPPAVSQIPPSLIDVFTEIQCFSEEMKEDYMRRRFTPELAQKILAHYQRIPTLRILAHQPFVCWIMATMYNRFLDRQGYGNNPPRLTPVITNLFLIQLNRRLSYYYYQPEVKTMWSNQDKDMLRSMGKMALEMLRRNTDVFFKDNLKEYGLDLREVVMLTGLCTELPAVSNQRRFSFIHFTLQEYMAAFYVFIMFYQDSKNVLESGGSGKLPFFRQSSSKAQPCKAANVVRCAVELTLNSPLGQYDLFLRFLCGLMNPTCHVKLFGGFLFEYRTPPVSGLKDVSKVLEDAIKTAPADRVENLKECNREVTQEDL
ncbi:NLR family CARD domain-containing protein 3 isoform X1 [Oryzias latipes]|uniref:Pyrin domain-containing protein n=2 Tax=Oryzias latipes TaxID=8090 RepID=H2M625_ORYLA|nr:NLR family CARD domain-containing protein 3 isoform X1 [Oryzias latipes]